jgi:hypothetical protein
MGQWPDNRLSVLMRLTDLERQRPFSFPDIRGWKVLSSTGRPVGSVKEVFVDPNSRQPAMALLQYKTFLNFNTKMLLAPWHELRVGPDFVTTRWSEEELRPETEAQCPLPPRPGRWPRQWRSPCGPPGNRQRIAAREPGTAGPGRRLLEAGG